MRGARKGCSEPAGLSAGSHPGDPLSEPEVCSILLRGPLTVFVRYSCLPSAQTRVHVLTHAYTRVYTLLIYSRRYQGTDTSLMIPEAASGDASCNDGPGDAFSKNSYFSSFVQRYQREFGFTLPDRYISFACCGFMVF